MYQTVFWRYGLHWQVRGVLRPGAACLFVGDKPLLASDDPDRTLLAEMRISGILVVIIDVRTLTRDRDQEKLREESSCFVAV